MLSLSLDHQNVLSAWEQVGGCPFGGGTACVPDNREELKLDLSGVEARLKSGAAGPAIFSNLANLFPSYGENDVPSPSATQQHFVPDIKLEDDPLVWDPSCFDAMDQAVHFTDSDFHRDLTINIKAAGAPFDTFDAFALPSPTTSSCCDAAVVPDLGAATSATASTAVPSNSSSSAGSSSPLALAAIQQQHYYHHQQQQQQQQRPPQQQQQQLQRLQQQRPPPLQQILQMQPLHSLRLQSSGSATSGLLPPVAPSLRNTRVTDGEFQRSRKECLERYREKKARRLYTKKIRYHLRKINADKRPRIKGRFVKKEELDMQLGKGDGSTDVHVPELLDFDEDAFMSGDDAELRAMF